MSPSPPAPLDALRPNRIDAIRLALALVVLLSHGFPLVDGVGPEGWPVVSRDPLHRATGGQMFGGAMAVCLFFSLSGFLVTHSWIHARGFADFVLRRAARILPGFAAACLFSAFVAGALGAEEPGAYLRAMVPRLPEFPLRVATLQMLDLPPTFVDNPQPMQVNGSLWSLWYEALCYGTVPLLAVAGALRHRERVLALLLLVSAVVFLQRSIGLDLVPVALWGIKKPLLWLDLLRYFLAGAAVCLWRDRIHPHPALDALAVAALVGSALAGGWSHVLPFAGTWLLLRAAFAPPAPGSRWTVDLSYGLYLYGFPVQQLLVHFLPGIGTLALNLLAVPLALALACASWFGVERPALAGVRRVRWTRSAS